VYVCVCVCACECVMCCLLCVFVNRKVAVGQTGKQVNFKLFLDLPPAWTQRTNGSVIGCPLDIVKELPVGTDETYISWLSPVASDGVDGFLNNSLSETHPGYYLI